MGFGELFTGTGAGGGGDAMCSTMHFLDTSAVSSGRQATMVGQAAVHEFSIIYNLFPFYFHKRSPQSTVTVRKIITMKKRARTLR